MTRMRVYVPGAKFPLHMDAHRTHIELEIDGQFARVDVEAADDHLVVTISGYVREWPDGGDEEIFKVFPE